MTPSEWLAAGMGITLLVAALIFAVAITKRP
jgi:hypothetical protein